MNSNVLPMSTSYDSDSDYNRTPAPMPQTAARRAVKAHKADIAALKRQIRVEEQRIALQRERCDLQEKLRSLRTDGYKSDY